MDLVDQSYWDHSYENFRFYIEKDHVTDWMDRHAYLLQPSGSLFEFGCFPGRYMAHLGKQGWEVSGMDLAPQTEGSFVTWLQQNGIRTRRIEKADVLRYARETDERYDLVCSFGFIEHFENFAEMIALHDRILKPGGRLVISTPNFLGAVQNLLHRKLDAENLGRHYVPSMRPDLWKKQLEALGYEVPVAGCFGNFYFWADQQQRSPLQKAALRIVRKSLPLLKGLPDSSLYSPYCGIIARKKNG
jgi:SAM-dependent methyltransferase